MAQFLRSFRDRARAGFVNCTLGTDQLYADDARPRCEFTTTTTVGPEVCDQTLRAQGREVTVDGVEESWGWGAIVHNSGDRVAAAVADCTCRGLSDVVQPLPVPRFRTQ